MKIPRGDINYLAYLVEGYLENLMDPNVENCSMGIWIVTTSYLRGKGLKAHPAAYTYQEYKEASGFILEEMIKEFGRKPEHYPITRKLFSQIFFVKLLEDIVKGVGNNV